MAVLRHATPVTACTSQTSAKKAKKNDAIAIGILVTRKILLDRLHGWIPSESDSLSDIRLFTLETPTPASSKLFQLLGAHLLDLRLPDLVRHPGRGALGLVDLDPLALEEVYLLCASLPKPYVCVAPIGCLQSCLAGRFSGEDANLVTILISQGEVSGLFFGYDESS